MERPLTLKDREARRLLAVERVNQGYSQAAVAAFLGVTDRAVRVWMKTFRESGHVGLLSRGHPGRPDKLTPEQMAEVLTWFRQSPTAFGYSTHLWTASRVAALIRERFGVVYNPRYLSGWLSNRGVTPQRPQRVPRERDPARIDDWVRDRWPRIVKRGAERAHIVLIDETGVLMNPLVRRTLAPRGQTPTLPVSAGHRHKLSVIAALSLSPVTRRPGLYFEVAPHRHFRALDVADFLRDLLRHLRGRVIVVCDNGSMHKGAPIRELLADFPRLSIEYLPPYAPDLNPVEQLWNHLKYGHLANFVPHDLEELDDRVIEWLVEAKFNRDRLRSCYNNTPLHANARKLVC